MKKNRMLLLIIILLLSANAKGQQNFYFKSPLDSVQKSLFNVVSKLEYEITASKESSFLITNSNISSNISLMDTAGKTIVNIKSTGEIRDFFNKNKIKTICSPGLSLNLIQALDQEVYGKTSKYSLIEKQNYANPFVAGGLSLVDPAIGAFYALDQQMVPRGLKWWFFFGSILLLDLPSYSLVASDKEHLRNIGIFGIICDRLIFGSLYVYVSTLGQKIKKTGYKFDYSELDRYKCE